MDASYKIQRGIHVHLIQFFMCPEFWVHIKTVHGNVQFLYFPKYPVYMEATMSFLLPNAQRVQ